MALLRLLYVCMLAVCTSTLVGCGNSLACPREAVQNGSILAAVYGEKAIVACEPGYRPTTKASKLACLPVAIQCPDTGKMNCLGGYSFQILPDKQQSNEATSRRLSAKKKRADVCVALPPNGALSALSGLPDSKRSSGSDDAAAAPPSGNASPAPTPSAASAPSAPEPPAPGPSEPPAPSPSGRDVSPMDQTVGLVESFRTPARIEGRDEGWVYSRAPSFAAAGLVFAAVGLRAWTAVNAVLSARASAVSHTSCLDEDSDAGS